MKDWYVYEWGGAYYVVELQGGEVVASSPATFRDVAQATLRGKFRESA